MEEIEFLVAVPARDAGTLESAATDSDSQSRRKGIFRGSTPRSQGDMARELVESRSIPVGVLKENLTRVSQSMMQVLSDIRQIGDFRLKEVQTYSCRWIASTMIWVDARLQPSSS